MSHTEELQSDLRRSRDEIRYLRGELESNIARQGDARYHQIFRYYIEALRAAAVCAAAVSAISLLLPIGRFIDALTSERRARTGAFLESTADSPSITSGERINVIERIVEIEPSWLQVFFSNWFWPAAKILILILIVGILMFAFAKAINLALAPFLENSRIKNKKAYSLSSAMFSLGGIIFTYIRHRQGLLDLAVTEYAIFSMLVSFVFFASIFLTDSLKFSLSIFLFSISLLIFVGWWTRGFPFSFLTEFRDLLAESLLPTQATLLIVTLLPIFLVAIVAINHFREKNMP